jgi:hypothetical protein
MEKGEMHNKKPAGQQLRDAAKAMSPLMLFAALTYAALWPLSAHFGTMLLHGGRDRTIFLWDLWWVQHAVTVLHRSPLWTDYLFAPHGVPLAYHTLDLTDGLLGLLLGSQGNLILAHNLLLAASFVLSGYFTYLLVKELTGSKAGALFGGVLFAFGPARWLMVWPGHMNLSSTQWIPLFLFFCVRFIRGGLWRYAVFMALALAAVFYTGYQQVVFTVVLFMLILPPLLATRSSAVRHKPGRTATRGALFVALFLFITAPLLIELGRYHEQAVVDVLDLEWKNMSVEPQRLVNGMHYYNRWAELDSTNPLGRALLTCCSALPASGPIVGYTGVAVLLLGLLSLVRRKGRGPIVYWSGVILLLVWMMLGPDPEILGFGVPSITPALKALPGFNSVRAVIRYTIPLSIAAAILSGFIFSRCAVLAEHAAGRGDLAKKSYATAALLLTAALYIEFLKTPLHLQLEPQAPPPYYEGGTVHQETNGSSAAGTLLELPYWYSGAGIKSSGTHYETLYYQTIHQRPMLGGHVSRLGLSMARESVSSPVLNFFTKPRLSGLDAPAIEEIRECLSNFQVRFINVSRRRYKTGDEKLLRGILENELHAELIYQSNAFLTYDLKQGSTGVARQN